MTAEMIEKARQAISRKGDCTHGEESWYCASCKYEWKEMLPAKVAEFAASAVQDAVREIAESMENRAHGLKCEADRSERGLLPSVLAIRAHELRTAAAALREKYGLEGQ